MSTPVHPSLCRLQQLEQEVVGGEQARNKELQQRHRQRKNLADQRKVNLIRALSENNEESENVLLNVYNSIQEEVHAKSQMLVKVQGKVCLQVFLGHSIGLEQCSKGIFPLIRNEYQINICRTKYHRDQCLHSNKNLPRLALNNAG